MRYIRKKISEEEYLTLKDLEYKEQMEKLFPNGIPCEWACGYGYYGHGFVSEDGQWYVVFRLGSTMD